MKKILILLLLSGCATMDQSTSDGVGVGFTAAALVALTVPIASPLWAVPASGIFAGKLTHDFEKEHQP